MAVSETIRLHNGHLEFTALAAGDGPLVLCLNGFPDNVRSYRFQLPLLAEAGYRAVSVTLRGYEPKSQPADNNYSLDAIAQDVVMFIEELGEKRAHLVGHDWGAAIAYTAGAMVPSRFKSLTTMALPHSGRFLTDVFKYPRQLALSWYIGFFQLRGISDFIVARNDFKFIGKLWRDWSPGWDFPDPDLQDVISTFREPGVLKAALTYYRAAVTPRVILPHARAAARFKVEVPTLAITGVQDGCIDTDVFKSLMLEEDFPTGLEVRQVADAGHFPHQEQPEIVNKLLLDWLQQCENRQDGESAWQIKG